MKIQNNAYLYNLILASYFCEYDEHYNPTLGLDSSLCFYLFNYSKDLFFRYPIYFDTASIVSDSELFLNISHVLLSYINHVNNITYNNMITFKYLQRFNFTISDKSQAICSDIFYHNEPNTVHYHGLKFNILPIECVIAYCISQYNKLNQNLLYLKTTILLATIYHNQIFANNVLINLLQLKLNISKVLKSMIRDTKALKTFDILDCPFDNTTIKSRSLKLLEFCYG